MSGRSPMQHGRPEPHAPCDCERALERITSELRSSSRSESDAAPPPAVHSRAFFSPPPLPITTAAAAAAGVPAPAKSSLLPATLERARTLTHHWGRMNGCAHAAAHMRATQGATLARATDAIELVLRDLEVAFQLIADTSVSSLLSSSHRQQQRSTPGPVGLLSSMAGHHASDGTSVPVAWIGDLELEHHEGMIVIEGAIKHATVRLAAMLQDVEEEVAAAAVAFRAAGSKAGGSGARSSNLPDHRRTKELMARLFRLLGTVNKIGSVDSEMS